MIGVAEEDFRVEVVEYVAREDAFDGRLGADRHEDRCFDVAMRGVENAGAGASFGAGSEEVETGHDPL